MQLTLTFDGLSADVESAHATVRLEDASHADAPARQLSSTRVGPFSIRQAHPRVVLDVGISVPADEPNLSLFIRVDARTSSGATASFVNTTTANVTTTNTSEEPGAGVHVSLQRIA